MDIYLPIAEQSLNVLLILGIGALVGFLSGMFGVGGGFIMTPLLIFAGITPPVAVAVGANQVVASSVSGAIAQWRRNNVDIKMGLVLLAGGMVGSLIGVQLVTVLRRLGHIDLVISLSYVFLLGAVGSLMFVESLGAVMRARGQADKRARTRRSRHNWSHALWWRTRFPRSKLYISIIPPLAIGFMVGMLSAVMGVGGGFIMVPAMIYLLAMPTAVVIGTSLFQISFVTGAVTILNAVHNQTVDIVLAAMLMPSGVIGAQIGARIGQYLKAEQLRLLLAIMVLAMSGKLALALIAEPAELFSLQLARL